MPLVLLLLLLLGLAACGLEADAYMNVDVTEFGAKPDNSTDNTQPFRAALRAVEAAGGGEVLVPGPAATAIFRTAPFNLTSNVVLRGEMLLIKFNSCCVSFCLLTESCMCRAVEGTIRAVEDRSAFPQVAVLPSYGSCCAAGSDVDGGGDTPAAMRVHPFVWAVGGSNITITGPGTIDGAGAYWWPKGGSRPHLLELNNISAATVTGVTLLNSAFWTFHPVCEKAPPVIVFKHVCLPGLGLTGRAGLIIVSCRLQVSSLSQRN